jgi:EmrB/QacA subfamily drug resistance transporter
LSQRHHHTRQEIGTVFVALVFVLLLAALDQTIVSTALPTIVGELGGLNHLSWIVTAYLLTSTVSAPLYGKLGDLYGRKTVLQSAIVIFLFGSALCGMSQSMLELIAFRALQGLGGGGLLVTTMVVIGDLVPPRERGRYQGFFGAVFGVSTVIGPLIGGFIVEHFTWRWIFYVNLPVGVLALAVIAWAFRVPSVDRKRVVDYLGAALLSAALTCAVLFTSLGGTTMPWSSSSILGLLACAILCGIAFAFAESKVREPLLPPLLFANSTFSLASAIGFIVGMALFGSLTYLPLFLQVVKGMTPSASGLHLAPMMLGVLCTSVLSGQLIVSSGRYKIFPVIGTGLMTIGMALLAFLREETSVWIVSSDTLVLGLGLGMVMQVLVMAVQNAVPFEHLGAATAGATLFRMTGGSVGVALFGAIFANRMAAQSSSLPSGFDITVILRGNAADVPQQLASAYTEAIAVALQPVFLVATMMAAFAFLLALYLPELPLKAGAAAAEGLGESFASPRQADSLAELQRILSSLTSNTNRPIVYRRLAKRAGIDLGPQEIWLLARIHDNAGASAPNLEKRLGLSPGELQRLVSELLRSNLISQNARGELTLTREGHSVRGRLKKAWERSAAELCSEWAPGSHPEIQRMLDQLIRALRDEMPGLERV